MSNHTSAPRDLFKSPSGPIEWQEADSLLPETPIHSSILEISRDEPYVVTTGGVVRRARFSLYGSHFLSTWGQRAWEFLVGLVMLDIFPSSLLLVSIFGLCDSLGVVLFGNLIGSYVDKTPRLRAACVMYIVQNISVALSAASCFILVLHWGSGLGEAGTASHGFLFWTFVTIAILAGSISSLFALGATLSVEREWTKTLCGSNSEALAGMNAVMKRIDLTCLIASPIGVGLLMSWRIDAAIVGVFVWNMAAWFPECSLLSRALAASEALQQPKPPKPDIRDKGDNSSASSSSKEKILARIYNSTSEWLEYMHQPAMPAAFSLSLLYFTIMSFGSLMTAYLKWNGLGDVELSIYRGAGALSGIAATVAFPVLHGKLGLVPTGVAAILAQFICLFITAAPSVLFTNLTQNNRSYPRIIALGLVFSRFGLWGFDLAANQIIQELVPSHNLGQVLGVQGSLQSAFQMMAYVAGVVVWQPERFRFLIAGSVIAVGGAALIFCGYAVRTQCSHIILQTTTSVRSGNTKNGADDTVRRVLDENDDTAILTP